MGVCGLEKDIEYRRTVMEGYKNEIEPLFWYIPWLESRYGKGQQFFYLRQFLREDNDISGI